MPNSRHIPIFGDGNEQEQHLTIHKLSRLRPFRPYVLLSYHVTKI